MCDYFTQCLKQTANFKYLSLLERHSPKGGLSSNEESSFLFLSISLCYKYTATVHEKLSQGHHIFFYTLPFSL